VAPLEEEEEEEEEERCSNILFLVFRSAISLQFPISTPILKCHLQLNDIYKAPSLELEWFRAPVHPMNSCRLNTKSKYQLNLTVGFLGSASFKF
jgi:hypothetical protein